MTREHEASRRIVKSAPEVWAECSEPDSLARHLGEFGEIKVTRVVPETTVAWEGERASGTVRIEPSGWGTRVTLTARTEASEAAVGKTTAAVDEVHTPDPVEEERHATAKETLAEPDQAVAPVAPRSRSRWRRLRERMGALFTRPEPEIASPVEAAVGDLGPEASPEEPDSPANVDPEAVLVAALDSLGKAHHRPFSRA